LVLVGLLSVAILVVAGCSHKTPTVAPPVAAQTPKPFDGHATIYELAPPGKPADENGLVSVPITVSPKSSDPARDAMDALIGDPHSPIPHGTKLIGLTINDGIATVNFSKQFQDNFAGGDTREAAVLESVLQTLGQFSSIQNVQFLVEGQKISSLGGTQDLTEPLPVVKGNTETAAGT
jgi:hypothetical protein